MKQPASIGRMVHYKTIPDFYYPLNAATRTYGASNGEVKTYAAIIVDVHDADAGSVTLFVLDPEGVFFNRASFDANGKPGCWSWPPFVSSSA